MRTRRDFLSGAAGLALLPYASGAAGAQGTLVNDIHSQLNATRVDRVVAVDSEAALRRAIRSARHDARRSRSPAAVMPWAANSSRAARS